MAVDLYMACVKCKKALHVAQDGLGGFTFYWGQEDTMRLLRDFLRDHYLCEMPDGNGVRFIPDHLTDDPPWVAMDSHGVVYTDDEGE